MISLKVSIRVISILLLVFICNMFLHCNNEAKAEDTKNNIIILIDNSGSMKSGIGDLAKIACNMALDCLDSEKVNIGIITFGEKVTVLNDINQSQDNLNPKKAISEVDFHENYTNMKDGLKEAINQLSNVDGNKSILILSDGVETAEGGLAIDHKAQMKELEDEAAEKQISVSSVALSNEVESEFLNSIAVKTGGTFRDGKTADKLFEAITSIVGVENDLITVANFSTLEKKSEKIKISEAIEEVVINVAAADNIQPDMEVRINGEILEPSTKGDLYEVYKFKNTSSSEIEITQRAEGNTSLIIQLKSKAKLKVLGDYQNYLSLPMNLSKNIYINLDCGENKIPEGAFVQRDGINIHQESEDGTFLDVFKSGQAGKEVIRYTAKDGNGGIIAIAELVVSVNDYPPYDYKDIRENEKYIIGDIVSIAIVPKGEELVKELGGTLLVKTGGKQEEIQLVESNGVLTGEFKLKETGNIQYYAYIRGIRERDNSSFEYKLEKNTIEVFEKPFIKLSLKSDLRKVYVVDTIAQLTFEIMPESIIQQETDILILNNELKEIGNLKVKPETKEVIVKVPLKDITDNLVFKFKASSGVQVTESLNTNIRVVSKWTNLLDKYIKPILVVILVLAIVLGLGAGVYSISMYSYKENIKINSKKYIEVSYNFKPRGRSDSSGGDLSMVNKKLYLNMNPKTSKVELDYEEMNITLGEFRIENIYEVNWQWVQGFKCFVNRRIKPIRVYYSPYETQEIYICEELAEDKDVVYENEDAKIIYSINKINKLEIEFKL